MALTCWVWLVALGSTSVASAEIPEIGCFPQGTSDLFLGTQTNDECESVAAALNKLDGVSNVNCDNPNIDMIPVTETDDECNAVVAALNKLGGVSGVECKYKSFAVGTGTYGKPSQCDAVAARLTVILNSISAMAAVPGPYADCSFVPPTPTGQNGTATALIHDIDDACCKMVQDELQAHSKNPPECVIGKNMSEMVSLEGVACTGDPCDVTSMMPVVPGMKFNSVDWYGVSADCCTFLREPKPPVPAGCPPKSYCMKMEVSFTKGLASMAWLTNLKLAAPKHADADVMVV